MKIISIIGTRPEFLQSACLSRALRPEHEEVLVHTGQHYDRNLSDCFFSDLALPEPDFHLKISESSSYLQMAQMLSGLEPIFRKVQPRLVVVRGDTNSSLAGALVAAKAGLPIAHIEAGERSFDAAQPEERNRIVIDHLSKMHFCVSETATKHLAREGITETVHKVGDVLYDLLLATLPLAREKSAILETLELGTKEYALVTIHRADTVDNPARLAELVDSLNSVSGPIILPLHPHTRLSLQRFNLTFADHLRIIDPVGYFDMLQLESNARIIATDSGGVQREAYFLGIPCLTLRDCTEWTETIDAGWNALVGVNREAIEAAWNVSAQPVLSHPALFGDGSAAEKIVELLSRYEHTL